MAVVKWRFTDPVTSEVFIFDINPSPSSSAQPEYNKTLTYESTSDAGGQTIVFEGRSEPQRMEWEGVVFTQEEHERFVEWWQKRYQIEITDDLGETFLVYLTNYRPKRGSRVSHRERRTYSMTATLIGT